ncbi:DUF2231 domain-containing protein [Bacteroidota bacterium]
MFDWIPNLHPIIVHFPIALITAAVVTDIVVLILRRGADSTVSWLYGAGTVGLVAAFLSGRAAADSLLIPVSAQTILTDHADWALITLGLFIVLTVGRLVMTWLRKPGIGLIRMISVIGGIVGFGLITVTGDLGGRMVFGHGVGVATPPVLETTARPDVSAEEAGSLGAVLGHSLTIVSGDPSETVLAADSTVLTVYLQREDLVFVTDEAYNSVQIEVELNLDRFKGRASAYYGFVSDDATDYIEFSGGTVEQGRVSDGKSKSFDTAILTTNGWFTLTAVSDGSHFRGYVDGALVVHGHDDASADGAVGFGFDGSGLVQVRGLSIQRLR